MSKQIQNHNDQATSPRAFGFWSLGFPWTLGGLVELGRRDFGGGNPLLERQQALSDLRGNISVVHQMLVST
ncbi:MAG: hypothetical protein IAG10_02405 [Planctomycetaceae bacterium]|nr:hypothetical protein [Planctomycetaceae bacterium]